MKGQGRSMCPAVLLGDLEARGERGWGGGSVESKIKFE